MSLGTLVKIKQSSIGIAIGQFGIIVDASPINLFGVRLLNSAWDLVYFPSSDLELVSVCE